jgi:hypothetical protein
LQHGVGWHAARDHVVEDSRHPRAEVEAFQSRLGAARVGKDAILWQVN